MMLQVIFFARADREGGFRGRSAAFRGSHEAFVPDLPGPTTPLEASFRMAAKTAWTASISGAARPHAYAYDLDAAPSRKSGAPF
jgi:hypothetical protein